MSNFWKNIWDSKGMSESKDLLFLDGYEHLETPIDSKLICSKLVQFLGIERGESLLEVGCGAGFLSKELNFKYDYIGVDYSSPLVKKHLELFPNHKIKCSEAVNLPFPDDSLDYAFCFGVYQYLPDFNYALKMISEMERVSKKSIILGDLKETATRDQHLPCPKEQMIRLGFQIIDSFYEIDDCSRYNAFKKLTR